MSLIPDKELEELRSRADIVQVIGDRVPLKKAGRNFKGICPFHAEKTPSFMVNQEKQIYHCFGCGEGGNVISFVMKYEGLEFLPAVEKLAERFGVVLSRTSDDPAEGEIRQTKAEKELFFRINHLACRFFHDSLLKSEVGKRGRDYLEKRGIRPELWQEFLLGYAPVEGRALTRLCAEKKVPIEAAIRLGLIRRSESGEVYDFFRDRLVFAILSGDGKVLGFSGRVLDETVQPKYLNSPESPVYHKGDSLLGIYPARPAIREKDQVILVEGNFDLIRLHQEGIRNVVAPLGTALTEPQVRSLTRMTRNFILLFDGDEAGVRAAHRALEIFLPIGILPRAILLPKGEDPDSFVHKQGKGPLEALMTSAPLLLDIRVEHILDQGRKGPQQERESIREILELIANLPGDIEKSLYIQRVAERTGISEPLLLRELSSQKGRRREGERKGSNFLAPRDDDKGKSFPPIEKTILEVLLSGNGNPEVLFREIEVADFRDPDLGGVWEVLKEDYEHHASLDLARVLMQSTPEPFRKIISELSLSGNFWGAEMAEGRAETGMKATEDCVRQVRVTRIKGRLKDLSREIRKAEIESDLGRVQELLGKKNQLLKEMMSLH